MLTHEERCERRRAMTLAVRNGQRPQEVAAEFGVSTATVYLAIKEHFNGERNGPTERRPYQRERSIFRDKAVQLRMRGMTASKIATYLGLSRERVGQFLRPLFMSRVALDEKYGLQVEALATQGLTHSEICRQLNLTLATVSSIIGKPDLGANSDKKCAREVFGKRFGALVVSKIGHTGVGGRRVEVTCDCGQVKTVKLSNLKRGTSGKCVHRQYRKMRRTDLQHDNM